VPAGRTLVDRKSIPARNRVLQESKGKIFVGANKMGDKFPKCPVPSRQSIRTAGQKMAQKAVGLAGFKSGHASNRIYPRIGEAGKKKKKKPTKKHRLVGRGEELHKKKLGS